MFRYHDSSHSMRGTPYGAPELRATYHRNLFRGLIAASLLTLLLIGWFLLGDSEETRARAVTAERLRDLSDSTPRIQLLGEVRLQKAGGGGAPTSKAPTGYAQRGHPDARPDRTHDRPDPKRSVVPQTPTRIRPVERATTPTPAGDTRDTSAERGVTGTRGQAVNGRGTTEAGGAGGPGIGNSAGLPGIETRGWVRPPQKVYPATSGATGKVTLRFTVMPNGVVENIRVIKSADPALKEAAIRNLKNARMKPLPSGAPQIPQSGTQTFTFVTQ